MSTLDDLRLQAGLLMKACAAANAMAGERKAKLRRGRKSTVQGIDVFDSRLAIAKGAKH